MLKKSQENRVDPEMPEKKPYANLSPEQLDQLKGVTQSMVVPGSAFLVSEAMDLLLDPKFQYFLGRDTAKALEIIITPSDVLGEWCKVEWYGLRDFLLKNKACLQNCSLRDGIDPLVLKKVFNVLRIRLNKLGLDIFKDKDLIADLKRIICFQNYPDHQPYSEMIIDEAVTKGYLITTEREPGKSWFLFPSEKFFHQAKNWLKNTK